MLWCSFVSFFVFATLGCPFGAGRLKIRQQKDLVARCFKVLQYQLYSRFKAWIWLPEASGCLGHGCLSLVSFGPPWGPRWGPFLPPLPPSSPLCGSTLLLSPLWGLPSSSSWGQVPRSQQVSFASSCRVGSYRLCSLRHASKGFFRELAPMSLASQLQHELQIAHPSFHIRRSRQEFKFDAFCRDFRRLFSRPLQHHPRTPRSLQGRMPPFSSTTVGNPLPCQRIPSDDLGPSRQ